MHDEPSATKLASLAEAASTANRPRVARTTGRTIALFIGGSLLPPQQLAIESQDSMARYRDVASRLLTK
jgi:hypothetical protein